MSEDRPRHPLDPLTADEVVRAWSLVRLDVTIDPLNSVYEVNTVADPPGPENPHHNAFRAEASLLRSEAVAQRTVDPLRGRFWKIVNPSVRNRLGQPVGYKLVPGENVLPFAGSEAAVTKRATFMTKHLWVTRYDPRERYAAGDYPNQHPGGAGLPTYVEDDAPSTTPSLWSGTPSAPTTWCGRRTGR